MAIDVLQDKIRKTKNPSVISLDMTREHIPAPLREANPLPVAYGIFCRELLAGLKGVVPAVRIPFGTFALLGPEGLEQLTEVLKRASNLGYYVLLDLPELTSPASAENAARTLAEPGCPWRCDGVTIGSYLGTDILRPFLPLCKETGKDVFVIARTANKSAAEIQDLLTGSRLVHAAVADSVSRIGETLMGKSGYSQIAVAASAASGDSLRSLRGKYPRTFLLMDGYDVPGGNAKNCGYGFDRLGHGAAACAGTGVTAAWMQAQETDYVAAAGEAAGRMKRNLARYTAVL